ncbi:unnamed protein product, partial [Polarella glacialis]
HRRLSPPVGGERFPLPPTLEPLGSERGQQLFAEARVNSQLVESLLRQDHPAFCAVASAMTVALSEQVGPSDQRRFMDVFQEAPSWPPVLSHYGCGALDGLPGPVKYHLLRHLQYDGSPMSLLAEWFRAQGLDAEAVSAGDVDADTFRSDVLAAFPKGDGPRRCYVVANYS